MISEAACINPTVVMQPVKNLIFFLFKSKNRKRDPLDTRPQDDRERQIYENFYSTLSDEWEGKKIHKLDVKKRKKIHHCSQNNDIKI